MTGQYKVKRSSGGSYVKGIYQPGPDIELNVYGSLQPTSAREMKLPEEGNRIKQMWKFFSDQPIVVSSNSTMANADIVTINGETYRAMALTIWQNVDLEYFMSVVWREPEQQDDGQGN